MSDNLPNYVKIYNGKFYYRRVVPKNLVPLWELTHIKRLLSTDIGEASQRAHDITLIINAAIKEGTREAKDQMLKLIGLEFEDSARTLREEIETRKLKEKLNCSGQHCGITTIKQAIEGWIKYHREERRNSQGTLYKYKDIAEEIKWALGEDTQVSLLDESIVKALNAYYCSGRVVSLELRRNKSVQKSLGIKAPYSSDAYVSSKVSNIRNFLRWLKISRLTGEDLSDQLPGPVVKQININKKTSFTDDEIKYMHDKLLPYKDMDSVKVSDGRIRDWRWRYWVFVLGLYTGARPVEICQLEVGDVLPPESKDPRGYQGTLGCWCLWISNLDKDGKKIEEKRIKNAHSYRLIPIHPWLIDNGFLDYYRSKKVKDQRLLFDLTANRYQGYRRPADKIYNEDIIRPAKALGIIHQGVTWACTRHNAETQIAHAPGMAYNERRIWRSIVGRVRDYDDPVESEYTDDYSALKKLEIIKLLNYNI